MNQRITRSIYKAVPIATAALFWKLGHEISFPDYEMPEKTEMDDERKINYELLEAWATSPFAAIGFGFGMALRKRSEE